MRFILTQQGENLVKVMEEEHTSNQSKIIENKAHINTFSAANNSSIPNNRKYSTTSKFGRESYTNQLPTQGKTKSPIHRTIKQSHSQTKIIDIHQKKLNIPKMINEKYNHASQNESSSLILPELPKHLNSRNRTVSMNFDQSATHNLNFTDQANSGSPSLGFKLVFPLKDVIPERTYVNTKSDLKLLLKQKEKASVVTENDFRSIYKEKSEVEDIEELMNRTKLDTGKVNLIQYLNSKETISHKFLKNLSKANDEKINKINKYCQIISSEREFDKLRSNIVKEKIKNKYIKDKNDCNNMFSEINHDLEVYKKICGDYNKTFQPTRKERFNEIHKDIQKNYWTKYNVDLLQRKSNALYLQQHNSSVEPSDHRKQI